MTMDRKRNAVRDPEDSQDGKPAESPVGLRHSVLRGITWAMLIYGAQVAAQLVFISILARLLTPYEYGVMAAAAVFIMFAQYFTNLGLNSAIIQIPTLDWRMQRVAYGMVVVLSCLCCAIMFFVAPAAVVWFRNPNLEPVVRTLSLIFLFRAGSALASSILFRALRARDVYTSQLVSTIAANLLVTIPMALLGYSYWSLVMGTLAQEAVRSVILRLFAKTPAIPVFSLSESRELLKSSGSFSVAGILTFISMQADNMIVGRFMGAASLGLYSRAYNLMNLPYSVYGTVADRTVFPAMASVQNELSRLKTAYAQGLALTAFIGIPLSVFLWVSSPELIRVIFGAKWLGAVVPFQILALSMYFRVSGRVSSTSLSSRGRLTYVMITNFLQAALVAGGCLLTYPYGLPAVAWAVTATFIVGFAVVSACASRDLGQSLAAFAGTQWRGLALGLLVLGIDEAARAASAMAHAPAAATLGASVLACGIAVVTAMLLAPKIFVGPAVGKVIDAALDLARRQRDKFRQGKSAPAAGSD